MGRRYKKHHRYSQEYNAENWWERRRQGYGMNLYRNTEERKVAGVCAGLADHFNVDHWVMRVIAIAGFVFLNSFMFFVYLAAWFCLAPRSRGVATHTRYRYDEHLQQDRPVNMFRYQMSSSERLKTAQKRMNSVLDRVTRMERYVTSRRYELDKEFSKMEK
jgi:phage shock protein C